MPKLSTFDLIGIGLRHLNEITEAVPHFVKGLEVLRPLLDELSERGVTSESVKEALIKKGLSDFERQWFAMGKDD